MITLRSVGTDEEKKLRKIDAASDPAPWTAREWDRRLWGENDVICTVADFEHKPDGSWLARVDLAGFIVHRIRGPRLEILRLGVHPSFRRVGVATTLVRRVMDKVGDFPGGRESVSFDVRETNLPMQLMLRKLGMRAVRVVPGGFSDGDAYHFRYAREMAATEAPR
jgi:ribosomal protein S18 acetylase RimI-like enzyme